MHTSLHTQHIQEMRQHRAEITVPIYSYEHICFCVCIYFQVYVDTYVDIFIWVQNKCIYSVHETVKFLLLVF